MTTSAEDRARMRAYYRANRDKLLAYSREYRKTHACKKKPLSTADKLKRSEYHRNYYARNKEKCRERQKRWLTKHPGYMAERARIYRQQLKELEEK